MSKLPKTNVDEVSSHEFKTVITAKRRLFDLRLRELYQYRDLILLLVRRDFVSRYKQTVLGPLWAIIQPLFTTVVFTVIFGSLAGLTTADSPTPAKVPAFLFYMAGNILWGYFSTVASTTSNTFIANSAVMGKVYFPRLAVPVATAFSNLISFGIQLAMFVILFVISLINGSAELVLSPHLLLLPLVILQTMLLSTSIGIIISALTTKYRDLAMLVGFGLQLWQYATPVAYGLQLIPEQYHALYLLNPVTPALLTFRYALFGSGYFDLLYFLLGWGITLLLTFIGIVIFNRIERTFADTV